VTEAKTNIVLVIDYEKPLRALDELIEEVDCNTSQEQRLEFFSDLLKSYLGQGSDRAQSYVFETTAEPYFVNNVTKYKNETEEMFLKHSDAVLEALERETLQWLPAYDVMGFDAIGPIQILKITGTRCTMKMNGEVFEKAVTVDRASRRLVSRF
jgi:hypothetical protein